jgi:hypothetical protein
MIDLLSNSVPIESEASDLIPHAEAVELFFHCGAAVECCSGNTATCKPGWAFYHCNGIVWAKTSEWVNYPHSSPYATYKDLLLWDRNSMWKVVPPPSTP